MTNSHSALGEMERAPRKVWRDFSLNCLYKNTSAGSSVENSLESNLGVSGGESTWDKGSLKPHLVYMISRMEGREPTMSDWTALSRLRSIQSAQVAIHLLPSTVACGNILSVRNSCRTGPSSPSYTRATAIASCVSPS
jgi:hypothetical protein